MVRSIFLWKQEKKLSRAISLGKEELKLFKNEEEVSKEYLQENSDVKVLIYGHTHAPVHNSYSNGQVLINTGTWTKMYNLDFGNSSSGKNLTFAQIDIGEGEPDELLNISLNRWNGTNELPYDEV